MLIKNYMKNTNWGQCGVDYSNLGSLIVTLAKNPY
jgi:hypothetical protein